MQPSNQQPSEEDERQGELSQEGGTGEGTFYEFSAEMSTPSPAPAPVAFEEAAGEKIPLTESLTGEMQPGPLYPPLPSFYENMQVPAEKPPLSRPLPGPSFGQTTLPGFAYVPNMGYQPYPGVIPPTQARSSRKKLWIILSLVGTALLLICGLCSWGAYTFFAPLVQDATTVTNLASHYYQNLEIDNYDAAYVDLQVSDLTLSAFAQQAQLRETQLGSISSFTLSASSPQVTSSDSGATITAYTLAIKVSRKSGSYTAHLTFQKVEGNWKITSFDVI